MGFSDYFEPLLQLGTGMFGAYNQDQTRGSLYDSLRAREDKNFADSKAYNDAYSAYLQQKAGVDGANRAASAANARAGASAADATEANRQKAAKKALKASQASGEAQKAMYEPYRQSGLRLLPQMEKTYSQGMANSNMLSAYLNTPAQMQKLNQAFAPSQANIVLPKSLRGGNV